MATFGKSYASHNGELDQKFSNFKQNFKKIEEHNNDLEAPFAMEINQFSDMTEEEFLGLMKGVKLPKNKSLFLTGSQASKPLLGSAQVPESVNWFADGYVTKPYDQGSCGGCWAFATASSLESLATINGLYPKG